LGIEWARIEPSRGYFSNAELDHYANALRTCRAQGLKPVVTFSHFTTPLWFAMRGGFEAADSPELFAAFCGKAAEHLGEYMHLATTFNEANIQLLLQVMPQMSTLRERSRAMLAAAARATGSPKFSKLAYADAAITTRLLQEAHQRGYAAIKRARPTLPVGLTLTTQDIQPIGADSIAHQYQERLYGDWLNVAREHADFLGVTENGIATDDDARRIAFIDQALAGVRECLDEGIPVHSYMYWSLLDNFEWAGAIARANRI
jgi:beta-glucosidase